MTEWRGRERGGDEEGEEAVIMNSVADRDKGLCHRILPTERDVLITERRVRRREKE